MANTKPTTRTKRAARPARPAHTRKSGAGVMVLGFMMAAFAVINLFFTMTPISQSNAQIDAAVQAAVKLPVAERLALFSALRVKQEHNLAQQPSEPYGWSRLSYLRLATQGNERLAFEALRMSDLVSPWEAPQLPERAVMWWRLRAVETPEQKAYQDDLWRKAFSMERDATWDRAVQAGLVTNVGASLQATDHELYEEWKARIADHP